LLKKVVITGIRAEPAPALDETLRVRTALEAEVLGRFRGGSR